MILAAPAFGAEKANSPSAAALAELTKPAKKIASDIPIRK